MSKYHIDPKAVPQALAKARELAPIEADLITWTAVHGSLQLALRHPDFPFATRYLLEPFIEQLGQRLVVLGMLTPDILNEAEAREREFRPKAVLPPPEDG